MASIDRLPSGLWRAQVKKRGIRDSDTRATKAAIQSWAAKREAEIEADYIAGRTGARSNAGVTVGDAFKVYLDMVASKTDSAKWNGLRINNWLQSPLALLPLGTTKPHDINVWIAERKKQVKDATVSRELTLMSSAFAYAVNSKHWIEVNPCRATTKLKASRPRDRQQLTPEELTRIRVTTGYDDHPKLDTIASRVGASFLLALETGARSGELLRIKPAHYRKPVRTLWIAAEEAGGRKSSRSGTAETNPSRDVPLSVRAMELLDQLVETMPAGQPYVIGLTDSQRDANWRKCRDRAMIENLTFHDLKHEAATRLSKFIDVIALSHAIGTKDLRLLRDTYYINNANATAALLPNSLTPCDANPRRST